MNLMIYGHKGWIGNSFLNYLKSIIPEHSINIFTSNTRILKGNYDLIVDELKRNNITHIFVAVGTTRDNKFCSVEQNEQSIISNTIDYVEGNDKLELNLTNNLFAQLMMLDIANKYKFHTTILGTGCIFDDTEYLESYGKSSHKYSESDIPNYTGSSYSIVKGILNNTIQMFDSPFVLHLRIRMPISNGNDPYDYIAKVVKYKKVIDIPNSMTVLEDCFPIMYDMIKKSKIGTYNLVNPGTISAFEILELYKTYVDSDIEIKKISSAKLHKITKGKRCNVELSIDKLLLEYPNIPTIWESVTRIIKKLKIKN